MNLDPVTNPDAQEALSTCYANDLIVVRRLRSGRWAVFNTVRELCGIVERLEDAEMVWRPTLPISGNILEDLGLT